MFSPARTPFSSLTILLILAVLIVIFGISAWLVVSRSNYHDSDFFTFWLAGRLLSGAQNPYDVTLWLEGHRQYGAAWIPNSIFPYPLPLAVLTLPLGLFSLEQAFFLWILLSQIFITLSLYLSIRWDDTIRLRHYFLPLLLGAFLFRPALVALRNGQLSPFLLLLVSLVSYLWTRHKWWQGAVVAAFLLLKPTIGLPVLGLCCIYLFLLGKYRPLMAAFLAALLIAVAGWLIDPGWISMFLSVGSGKFNETFGYNPSVWGLTGFFCRQSALCTVSWGGLFALVLVAATVYLLLVQGRRMSPALLLSLVIPVSLLITPYLWAYDQILLLVSVCMVVELLVRKRYPYMLAASFPLLFSLLSLLLLSLANTVGHDAWSAALPLLMVLLVGFLISKNPPGSIIYPLPVEQTT